MRSLNKHAALYLLGIFIQAYGICLIAATDFGASPWDLLCISLARRSSITVGQWQIICNISMIILTKIIFRRTWNFWCLIPGIVLGMCIDGIQGSSLIPAFDSQYLFILGCIVSAAGLSLYVNQGYTANAIDNFFYMCRMHLRQSDGLAKIVCDLIPIVILMIMSIPLTWGTLFIYIMVPIFIQLWHHLFNKCQLTIS